MEKSKYQPGDKVGHLEIIGDTGMRTSKRYIIYKCRCECGNIVELPTSSINEKQSCGCKSLLSKGFVEGTQLSQIDPNKKLQKNNTSGYPGVMYRKGHWKVQIGFRNKKIHLGIFDTYEEAVSARKAAEKILFYPIWARYNPIMT